MTARPVSMKAAWGRLPIGQTRAAARVAGPLSSPRLTTGSSRPNRKLPCP
jgi:hypothetical protein